MPKKPDPNELVHKHVKIPRWMSETLSERATASRRNIQAQLAVDLESIAAYAERKPKAKKAVKK